MAEKKFKYTINDQINLLPREISIDDLIKIFEKAGISRDTFYRDRKIASGSDQSIPSDRLFTYADLFGCEINDLISDHRKTIRSIREQVLRKTRKIKNQLS